MASLSPNSVEGSINIEDQGRSVFVAFLDHLQAERLLYPILLTPAMSLCFTLLIRRLSSTARSRSKCGPSLLTSLIRQENSVTYGLGPEIKV